MAKIIQILHVDSDGHTVRLSNGRLAKLAHSFDPHPHIGQELFPSEDSGDPEAYLVEAARKAGYVSRDHIGDPEEWQKAKDAGHAALLGHPWPPKEIQPDPIIESGEFTEITDIQAGCIFVRSPELFDGKRVAFIYPAKTGHAHLGFHVTIRKIDGNKLLTLDDDLHRIKPGYVATPIQQSEG